MHAPNLLALEHALEKLLAHAREHRVGEDRVDHAAAALVLGAAAGDQLHDFAIVCEGDLVVLADALLARVSQLVSSAGVAAVIRTPRPGPAPQSVSSCLLLENIQDPGNLGSILRTAVAAGVLHVFLSKGSVFAWAPKVIRAGMGAHFFLSIFEGVEVGEFTHSFRGSVVALEPRAEVSLYDLDLRGPVAWVLGNEGAGLSEGARRLATHRVRIPMPGPAESLNVAAAAAICLFEQIRQRSGK